MISAFIELALSQRVVVIGLSLVLLIAGLFAFSELDIEAYPDPVQPMVEVLTLPNGLSAEEVERLVTVPLEFGLGGMRNLESMRSISLFGLSDIRCYFDWESDYYQDRTDTINQLGTVSLPQGVRAGISPENPIGEIYRYTVESPDHDLIKEKEIEDWVLEQQLKTVPGVIDVSGFGGLSKEYHVDVDPQRLAYYRIPLSTLLTTLGNANISAGGNYLDVGEQAFDVRGLGFIESLDDIRNAVLAVNKSTPVTVANVASVEAGYAPRLGIVGMNNRNEIVEGIVLMRKYGNTLKTLGGVESKIHELNSSGALPTGYKAVPYYDRTELVETTLHTVLENLTIGMALVFLVLIFFLGNFRSAFIAAINIPLALLGAFILMRVGDTPANLISLGAIDFGIIINSTVIVVENIHQYLAPVEGEGSYRRIQRATQEVAGPIFFFTLIFVIAFLPLFTMHGVEGAIFSPMSRTYAYALGAAILLSLALTPALASFAFERGLHQYSNPIWEAISRFYHWFFVHLLNRPRLWLTAVTIVVMAGFVIFPRLGGEFLPKLEEGNVWATATMPLTISLDRAARLTTRMRGVFTSFPEVTTVVSQLGRPDSGTETTGFFNAEFSVDLKPQSQWPPAVTKAALVKEMNAKLVREMPGVSFDYSQNIEANVDEALSGVKGSNSVKVFGHNLEVDERVANQLVEVMGKVQGIADLGVYRSLGQPNLVIKPDRAACARYGLSVSDVAGVVQAAIGGQAVTQIFEGDRRFDLVVRWKPQYRQSLDAIRNIRVTSPGGANIPLAQVADIRTEEGASFIYREGLERYVPLRFAVRGRDLERAVEDAKQAVAREVKLPEGVHLEWAGEYGELREANRRLMIVVPFAFVLIAGVLYAATTSLIDVFIIMAQIPVACLGGILGLYVTGTPFSVSAAVGFISIFGVAVMDGILLSFYIRRLWQEGHPFREAIVMGSDRRLRAMMMTDLVDAFGLLPAALSTRIGSQTQRPLAIVVIGGALAILLLTRILQPVLIYLCHRRLRLTDAPPPAPRHVPV
ncbi:MAG: efflux RND transporter permease subunit [Candidatus Binataceae bacterium]